MHSNRKELDRRDRIFGKSLYEQISRGEPNEKEILGRRATWKISADVAAGAVAAHVQVGNLRGP
jgi:hypothetical protein